MSHLSGKSKNDDKEGSGPRPPVPGEECCVGKMTDIQNPESSKNSQPSYLNWARSFDFLLEDPDGVQLFKEYVEEDSPFYNDHLTFYFACEGLKLENDLEKVKRLIKAIYSNFLKRKDSAIIISDDLRRTIKGTIKNEIPPNCHIFDELQNEVEFTIRSEVYPNFPTSMKYIDYIQRMSNAPLQEKTSSSSSSNSSLPPLLTYPEQKTTTPIPYGGSACGSAYGPSTSASSSGSISATDTLPRSSTLPTLHEESELSLCNEVERPMHFLGQSASSYSTSRQIKTAPEVPIRLTRDLLLATQNRRLDIRPPGAHGYLNAPRPFTHSSYMPNSRVDSERASISSGGRTDSEYSDTMSLSNCLTDGRPYLHKRKGGTSESKMHINKNPDIEHIIPRTLRHNPPPCNDFNEFYKQLLPKLNEIKRKQDMEDKINLFNEVEDDDQDILDQHVSRVFKDQTPHRSPGTLSPYPPLVPPRRRHDSGILSDATGSIGGHSMKHSKSMPENSSSYTRKLTNKWPSINTDSGISLYSADTLMKYKDNRNTKMGAGAMVSCQLEEAKRRLEEDSLRKSRRYSQQHPPPPTGVFMAPPPQPQSISSSSSGSSSLHHLAGQAPPLPAKPQETTTTVVFSFCDEDVPYRTRIPGTSPTLRQFKDYLPKKGNFRFFFKTLCDEPDNPVIQEEISNDSDVLPFFEGKVMGFVKPCD